MDVISAAWVLSYTLKQIINYWCLGLYVYAFKLAEVAEFSENQLKFSPETDACARKYA
jgi:hypothetical protein